MSTPRMRFPNIFFTLLVSVFWFDVIVKILVPSFSVSPTEATSVGRLLAI